MTYPGRLALQQRVLPQYRVPFLDLLARACEGGMSFFAGAPRADEHITTGELQSAKFSAARNIHLLSGPLYLCYQRGILQWLDNWNPDALIVEANPRYLSTPSAVRWMHGRGKPVLGWGLGEPLLSGPLAGLRQTRRLAFLRGFDALIAYSQRGADEYAALGFPREKIFVAYNSVSPAPLSLPPSRPSTLRQRFDNASTSSARRLSAASQPGVSARRLNAAPQGGAPNRQPVLLFVGRLQARKHVDRLLRACAQLEIKPRLVIVGDGPERAALERLAPEVYPSAQFVGAKHGGELRSYFTEADLFVLPGTGGLAVQEAMSYGLPVVVARGDGTQDDLVREANGWQIPPDDFSALVSTLNEALSDAARLRRMGAESYRIAAEEINIEKMVETFVKALNAVR